MIGGYIGTTPFGNPTILIPKATSPKETSSRKSSTAKVPTKYLSRVGFFPGSGVNTPITSPTTSPTTSPEVTRTGNGYYEEQTLIK